MVHTNADTIKWYQETLKVGNKTEENIKEEAVKFFGDHLEVLNKQTVKRKLEDFLKRFKAMKALAQKKAKTDESDYKNNDDFCAWLNEITVIDNFKVQPKTNKHKDTDENETLIIMNKQSTNIVEVMRPVTTHMLDGTVKKISVKEHYAKITTRTINKENEAPEKLKVSKQTTRNRRLSAEEVIDHLTDNNTELKAEMVSQIIDREGKDFAKKVKMNSKTLKENDSLNDEQTNSLMTGTRVPELAFRQRRTVLKKF